MRYMYTLKELKVLPTLQTLHFDDVKVQTKRFRILLSRTSVRDGAPYDNQVTVLKYVDNTWTTIKTYQAK